MNPQLPASQTQCKWMDPQLPASQTQCKWMNPQLPASQTQCKWMDPQLPASQTQCKWMDPQLPASQTQCKWMDPQLPASQTQCKWMERVHNDVQIKRHCLSRILSEMTLLIYLYTLTLIFSLSQIDSKLHFWLLKICVTMEMPYITSHNYGCKAFIGLIIINP